MNPSDADRLDSHIRQLSGSAKGRSAMRHVLDWLDDDGVALDQVNQRAILALMDLAWRYPGSTRAAMREAID